MKVFILHDISISIQWTISPVSLHKMRRNLDNLRRNFKQYIADFAIQIETDFVTILWFNNTVLKGYSQTFPEVTFTCIFLTQNIKGSARPRWGYVRLTYVVNDDFIIIIMIRFVARTYPPCWVLKARIQKHRGKPLLFHDKCPTCRFFYVHYTTHGTYSFTSHPKDEAIMVKCLCYTKQWFIFLHHRFAMKIFRTKSLPGIYALIISRRMLDTRSSCNWRNLNFIKYLLFM